MENEQVLTRKERRYQKIRDRVLNPTDIKYRGPLSYRYLRIIAWICFGIGQFVMMNAVAQAVGPAILSPSGESVISLIRSLSTPLFIIAAFGYVLGSHKTWKNLLILDTVAFLAIGIGFDIFYLRYIETLLRRLGASENALQLIEVFFKTKVDVNVFADLLSFALFVFLIEYRPKKFFQGKKIIYFRLLSILPLLYVAACYILKVLVNEEVITLSYYFYPFLTTKAPLTFGVFVTLAIWLHNREKMFLKAGVTRTQYKAFLQTNKNSLSFSIGLTIIIAIFALIDLAILIGLIYVYAPQYGTNFESYTMQFSGLGIGQALSMVLVIPFVMLFSYTRTHKKSTNMDLFVVLGGIGFTALMMVEAMFQILSKI